MNAIHGLFYHAAINRFEIGFLLEWMQTGFRRVDSQATLAQLVERLIRNQQVAGSIPAGGSTSR